MKLQFAKLISILALLSFAGCDVGYKVLGSGQYGVMFRNLPRWLGGGVRGTTISPSTGEFVLPWETLIVVDTTLQTIGWGGIGEGTDPNTADYVETRTVDGNEVGIAIEIQYRLDPERVHHIVQKVGSSMAKIRAVVGAVARADIRTHMNVLTTSDFFSQKRRDQAVQELKRAMAHRLAPEGVIIEQVIFRDYKFERAGESGQAPDRSYQQQIDETQAKIQETEQEEKRRGALMEEKGQEFALQEGERKRLLAWANGYERQAKVRGDSYLTQRKNEAAQVLTAGTNEVEAMKKRIAALSGPGGEALLRLEIAKSLGERKPRFVLMNSTGAGKGGIDVNRVDTNELLRQAGIFSALSESATPSPSSGGSAQKPTTPAPQVPAVK